MTSFLKHNTAQNDRYWDLDALRGLAILAMIIFHLIFDLSYFGLISADTIYKPGWVFFQQIIAGIFLFVAGVGFDLCHGQRIKWQYIKRRMLILGLLSALISGVTFMIFGLFWIKFGILHCILASSLIASLIVILSTFRMFILIAFLAAFYLYLNPPVAIPSSFDFLITTIHPHYSVDYRPIFPWLIVFLVGMLASRIIWRSRRPKFYYNLKLINSLKILIILGKNSLLIYMIHQPILFSVLYVYAFLG